MARQAGVPLIAVNDVLYHHPDRCELQDVLTCIREHLTIDTAGRRLAANAERYLKPPAEMARLFRDTPEAIEETRFEDQPNGNPCVRHPVIVARPPFSSGRWWTSSFTGP